MCELDPVLATYVGVRARRPDDRPDAGRRSTSERRRAAEHPAELDGAHTGDEVDEVTLAAMRERLGLELEIHEAGLAYGDLNVISSPPQTIRDVFDLMPTDTADGMVDGSRRG